MTRPLGVAAIARTVRLLPCLDHFAPELLTGTIARLGIVALVLRQQSLFDQILGGVHLVHRELHAGIAACFSVVAAAFVRSVFAALLGGALFFSAHSFGLLNNFSNLAIDE